MRVLFTALPASGHWHPLVPFAEALRAAGHEVAFATAPAGCAAISRLGFSCFHAATNDAAEEWEAMRERIEALGTGSAAGTARVMQNFFAGRWAAARLPALLGICETWTPAVLVREVTDFAGCVAAERAGLPHAAVQIMAWRPWLHPLIAEPLNRLREDVGLPPDPELAMLYRYLLLVPGPPGYQDVEDPLPATARPVRYVAFDRSGGEPLPAWVDALPDRPVVYATMGTVVNRVPGVLEAILEGLRDEPITLVVTTGRDRDLATFGPQPANVHIERYVPQSLLFPRCDLVVTHGGTGTVLAALDHGLPMVIIPVSADQLDNARRCEALGVAQAIAPEERTPESIREAVRAVLGDPSYRRNAEQLRGETARLPGPEDVVGWLERLATEKRPVAGAP
jgi:UDP:flavonoid glycosyltransferase YjiC (YdhE family)